MLFNQDDSSKKHNLEKIIFEALETEEGKEMIFNAIKEVLK